jgi:hypothetical protein
MVRIYGNDGRLVWCNFQMTMKRWEIQWDKPADGLESWRGNVTITQADLLAMMKEKGKSGPVPMNEFMNKPIPAKFYKEDKVYSGEFYIHRFPVDDSSYPTINFLGTGPLNELRADRRVDQDD